MEMVVLLRLVEEEVVDFIPVVLQMEFPFREELVFSKGELVLYIQVIRLVDMVVEQQPLILELVIWKLEQEVDIVVEVEI